MGQQVFMIKKQPHSH